MKIIKWVITLLVIIVAVILAIGLSLPTGYEVSRSIVVEAPPQEVHKYLSDLSMWRKWSPWIENDPSLKITLGEQTKGIGASQSWIGKDGQGGLTLTSSDPAHGINYDLSFNDGQYECESSFRYEQLGDTTKVIWSMNGEIKTPVIGGFLAYKMDSWVGRDFEKGLQNIKELVEGN